MRHILMPLYCAGLWLAVNMAPGICEVAGGEVELVGRGQPDHGHVRARGGRAVGERTGQAGRAGPHVVADDDLGRRPPPRRSARPVARARSSSSWSGTVPRTSYALKIACTFDGSRVSAMRTTLVGGRGRVSVGREHPQVAPAGRPRGRSRPPGSTRGGGAGRPASRTASASASRSSSDGPGAGRSLRQPQHLPPARRREALAVDLAQVVGMRLGVRRQRAEHGGLVGVDIGQRGDRRSAAGVREQRRARLTRLTVPRAPAPPV